MRRATSPPFWSLIALTAALLTASVARPGGAAPSAADRLRSELSSNEPARRQRAARELLILDPEAARPLIQRALDDPDFEVRVLATVAVGQFELVELAPRLLEQAKDADRGLRETTLQALGRLRTDAPLAERIVSTLARALDDPEPGVRTIALRAIADRPLAAGQRSALLQAISGCLADERPELRRIAAETLERLADPSALQALAARVDDPSPEVRVAIGRALGALGDPRAAAVVLRLLDDSSEEVRAAAVAALGALAAGIAVPQLASLLLRPHDPLAGPAAVALGRIVGMARPGTADDSTAQVFTRRAGELLVAAVQKGVNRAAALEGILVAGSAAATLLMPLLPPLGARPADDLLLLVGDLAAGGDERTTQLLLTLSPLATDARFESALVRARPAPGPTRDALVAWLAARLSDPGVAARRAAASALGTLADPRAALPLEAAIADTDPTVRRAALLALARTSAASLDQLLTAARGNDAELARAALEALARRRDEPARAALLAAVAGNDAAARRLAALALSDDAGAASTVGPLVQLLHSGSEAVRAAATLALLGPLRRHPHSAARERCLALAGSDDGAAPGALELLGAMRDVQSAPQLLSLLPRLGRRPIRRARLYAVLGDLLLANDDASIERALLGGLEDPDPGARSSAAWALSKASAPGMRQDHPIDRALVSHLADPSGAVRANALGALARRGTLVSAPLLDRLAHDPELAVRANAARLGTSALSTSVAVEQPAAILRAETAARRRLAIANRGGDAYALLRLLDAPGGAITARLTLPDGVTVVLLADERGILREEGLPTGELLVAATTSR